MEPIKIGWRVQKIELVQLYLERAGQGDEASTQKALQLLEAILAEEPDFVLAQALKGSAKILEARDIIFYKNEFVEGGERLCLTRLWPLMRVMRVFG